MIKKITLIIFIILFSFSGCNATDYTEPEDRTVITALIVEYGSEYTLTAEAVSVPDNIREKSFTSEILTGKGADLPSALAAIQADFSNELSLFHCTVIICDASSYQQKRDEILSFLYSNGQFSLGAEVLISDSLKNIKEFELSEGEFLGYEITELLELRGLDADIIDISKGRAIPPQIFVNSENKFELTENKNE